MNLNLAAFNLTISRPACFAERTCVYINISKQVPLEWALPLYGYVMPLIVLLTMATNSFIVVVLSNKYLRTPTNFVLLAMAVSELLTGVCCIPWFLYYYTLGGFRTDEEVGLPPTWCVLIPFMASYLPSIFHATAIWLTVFLAIQRYVYICVPNFVRRFCTIKNSKKMFFTIQTIFVHFGPCLLLVIFTWKLVAAIRVADKRHVHLLRKSSHRRVEEEPSDTASLNQSSTLTNGAEKRRSTLVADTLNTRMLLVVILLFLFTEIPAAVIFLVHVASVSFKLSVNYHTLNNALIFRNVLIVISYPLRFAIYCGMSQQFREVVQQMLITRVLKALIFGPELPKKQDESLQLDTSCVNDTRRTVLVTDSADACVVIRGTKDTAVQCDFDSTIVFDPLFDDLQRLMKQDSDDRSSIDETEFTAKGIIRTSRGTQCSAKVDSDLFVRRKSSIVAHALLDAATGCHFPVGMSLSTSGRLSC